MDLDEYMNLNNWLGSFYELSMEYRPSGDRARLLAAVRALWRAPYLAGPYPSPYDQPHEGSPEWWAAQRMAFEQPYRQPGPLPEPLALPEALEAGDADLLQGTVTLPGRHAMGCHVQITWDAAGADLLQLEIPVGMLELAFEVDYPIMPATNPWVPEVEEALRQVGEAVYAAAPFALALIGEEVAGNVQAPNLTVERARYGGSLLLPASLAERLRPSMPATEGAHGLWWFPWWRSVQA